MFCHCFKGKWRKKKQIYLIKRQSCRHVDVVFNDVPEQQLKASSRTFCLTLCTIKYLPFISLTHHLYLLLLTSSTTFIFSFSHIYPPSSVHITHSLLHAISTTLCNRHIVSYYCTVYN